jgi:hypothetical protein
MRVVKPLENSIIGWMVIHQQGDYFTKTHSVRVIALLFAARELILLPLWNEYLTKIIHIAKQ